jgi:hypothetical protein
MYAALIKLTIYLQREIEELCKVETQNLPASTYWSNAQKTTSKY